MEKVWGINISIFHMLKVFIKNICFSFVICYVIVKVGIQMCLKVLPWCEGNKQVQYQAAAASDYEVSACLCDVCVPGAGGRNTEEVVTFNSTDALKPHSWFNFSCWI